MLFLSYSISSWVLRPPASVGLAALGPPKASVLVRGLRSASRRTWQGKQEGGLSAQNSSLTRCSGIPSSPCSAPCVQSPSGGQASPASRSSRFCRPGSVSLCSPSLLSTDECFLSSEFTAISGCCPFKRLDVIFVGFGKWKGGAYGLLIGCLLPSDSPHIHTHRWAGHTALPAGPPAGRLVTLE